MYVCIAETSRAALVPRLTSKAGCSSTVSFHMLCDSWYSIPWPAVPGPRDRRSFSSRRYCPSLEAIPNLWAQGTQVLWPAIVRVLFVLAGIHLQLERGHPSRGSSAHQEVLFWCHFPQQPCDPLWLSWNEGEPALEIPKSESVCVGVLTSKVSNCLRRLHFLKMSPQCFIPSLNVAVIRESAESLLSLYHWLKRGNSPVSLVGKVRTPGLLSRGHCAVSPQLTVRWGNALLFAERCSESGLFWAAMSCQK